MQPYQHFTLDEREMLAEKLKEGKSYRQIAKELGRSPSTISREVRRNWSKTPNRYHPWRATVLYLMRRKQCRRRFRLEDKVALTFVTEGLSQYWPPETIARRWGMEHPDIPLSHTTIYRALYRKQLEGFSPKTHLRRHGRRKNLRGYCLNPDHSIHDRPMEAELRLRFGDMEGDTISGAIGKGCVLTVVDRKSRMLYAALCPSRDSDLMVRAFERALDGVTVESLTLDNGSEFARFREIENALDTTVYFADPHSPWQRGSNENINDVLRFFYPKGTDFTAVHEQELLHVLSLINNRPRKCLGWLSPREFLSATCCT